MKRVRLVLCLLSAGLLAGCGSIDDLLSLATSEQARAATRADHGGIDAPAGEEGQVIDIGTLPPPEERFSIAGLKIRTSVDEASDELILGGFRYDGYMWRRNAERLAYVGSPNGLIHVQMESAIVGSVRGTLSAVCALHGAPIAGQECRVASGDVEFRAWIDETGPAPHLRRQLHIMKRSGFSHEREKPVPGSLG